MEDAHEREASFGSNPFFDDGRGVDGINAIAR
jgi:hypothetical protein